LRSVLGCARANSRSTAAAYWLTMFTTAAGITESGRDRQLCKLHDKATACWRSRPMAEPTSRIRKQRVWLGSRESDKISVHDIQVVHEKYTSLMSHGPMNFASLHRQAGSRAMADTVPRPIAAAGAGMGVAFESLVATCVLGGSGSAATGDVSAAASDELRLLCSAP
jgi:hypothetical protein